MNQGHTPRQLLPKVMATTMEGKEDAYWKASLAEDSKREHGKNEADSCRAFWVMIKTFYSTAKGSCLQVF